MPVKYPPELKQRAIELVLHAQADPVTARGAVTRIAAELGVSKETLRVWVRKHKETGAGTPAESIDLEAENRRLRAELAEAKRANDILKRASGLRFCRRRWLGPLASSPPNLFTTCPVSQSASPATAN